MSCRELILCEECGEGVWYDSQERASEWRQIGGYWFCPRCLATLTIRELRVIVEAEEGWNAEADQP